MPLVTICTKLGLNDLASDTQDTCPDQRQKPVIKSLFNCLSCGFPFPVVHQVLSPPLSLAEWWGTAATVDVWAQLLCKSKKRRPLCPMRVQSSMRSNLQHTRSKCEVLQGSSTLHHSLPHAHVCKVHSDPGWHLHLVKHGSEGNGATCQVGRYPKKALQCSCPSWAVEVCWGTPEKKWLGWGNASPWPLHSQGSVGPGGELRSRGSLITNSWLGTGLGRGDPRLSFLCRVLSPSLRIHGVKEASHGWESLTVWTVLA